MKKISIVIPCYNEEEGIHNLAEQIKPVIEELKKRYLVELILVNDGSTDKTLSLLNQYFSNEDYAKIITYEKNRNLGGALKEGFKYITGDLVITADSDCTYPPKEIFNLLNLLDENTDVVTASPYHPKGRVANVPGYRLFLSRTVSLMYSLISKVRLYTYTAIFRVYRREVVDNVKIKSNGFIGVTELLIFAILNGYRVKEFPTTIYGRTFGQSKIKTLKVIKQHLRLILYTLKLRLSKGRVK